ncbi:DNA cytosine methyltransferase [uncultured Pseudodesulfovibrio sp.]|uniref:DNA cytosine methyltransferase n=1 Tax=uncultured Pseudodesulfovibrio sp. TaxID=2035858 RepID=UPI0029C903EA|nr:DNA cytosine methyltransferase [uncultured Pseudodesulfovibrio sp.]
MSVIDLFCGAGGLSEGFQQVGFDILAANDVDPYASETFQATHPQAVFFQNSVTEYTAQDFLDATGLQRGELNCLVGGPPCQGFSVYNHNRGMHDPRSGLFREYLRIVEGLAPQWVVMENVTGIISTGGGQVVQEIVQGLNALGYHVENRTLFAEQFGVPQERRRVFFIGNNQGLPIPWPSPTHGNGLHPYVTIGEAINDLPPLNNGEDLGLTEYPTPPRSLYQQELRGGGQLVHNHSAPRLGQINLDRMAHIPQGGSWRDIPFDLLPAGMKRAKRSDHTKRYGRLSMNGLASTILTKCDVHWGAFIHPEQNRALTVREAARLQSFPDHYHFAGPKTEQYVQVGNAVPPMLARAIAQEILITIENNDINAVQVA